MSKDWEESLADAIANDPYQGADPILYNLVIARKITLVTTIQIEGTSKESAVERFQHQLESGECSALDDESMWGECMAYQVHKRDPHEDEYEVIDVEEDVKEAT